MMESTSGRRSGVVLVDDTAVVTREKFLEIIVKILEEKKIELTPSKIKTVIQNRRLLPHKLIENERIFDVMNTSYENKEGIFYLSMKGRQSRRFGLRAGENLKRKLPCLKQFKALMNSLHLRLERYSRVL